jgi:hypothetical protein
VENFYKNEKEFKILNAFPYLLLGKIKPICFVNYAIVKMCGGKEVELHQFPFLH